MLTELQFPYTGPYGFNDATVKVRGNTPEALKRAMSRMGFIPWGDFTQNYTLELERALDKFDGQAGRTGYGKERWLLVRNARVPADRPHAGEYALDQYARWLVQEEAGITADSAEEEKVQNTLRTFWLKAIANRKNWHYSRNRPFDPTIDPEGNNIKGDCSSTPVQGMNWVMRQTGIKTVDPAKQNFSGWGNTDQYEDDWPKVASPFRIGDLAHFHSARHVIQCIKAGNLDTAEWGSNGSESAPELIPNLRGYSRFPDEFMFVVRPTLLA
jgi:hypothetical protein